MLNTLKKELRYILQFVLSYKNYRSKALPIFVETRKTGLKIHLGAGNINLQGWINVDALQADHIQSTDPNFRLSEFNSNAVSEVYLSHTLEHFANDEACSLIESIYEKLQVGGIIRVSVPDFDVLVNLYLSKDRDIRSIKDALVGGQRDSYDFHKSFYNMKELTRVLKNAGFSDVCKWDPLDTFGIDVGRLVSKKVYVNSQLIYISLNLQGTKNNA